MNEAYDVLADVDNVAKAIITFANSPEYRELDTFYRRKSNFEILGIHRNETRHSRFLAWILDPSGSHGLGTFGLKKFMEVCVMSRIESKQRIPLGVPDTLLDELIVGSVDIAGVTVKTELSLGKQGRIDIYLSCLLTGLQAGQKKLVMMVENKVNSKEHDNQTNRYSDWLKEHSADYDYSLLVYLTPVPTVKLTEYEEPDCECKQFLQINYQYVVDYLIEPTLTLVQPRIARDFISDYLRALSVPSVIVEDEMNKGDIIMAISEHERKLLAAFWEKHRSLILAAFYAISSDPNQDKEIRDDADKILITFGTKDKDYSQYTVTFDEKVILREVKKTAVGREVVRILIDEGITEDEFATIKADRSSAFQLLKRESEITENEKKYNRYRVGREEPLMYRGVEYYVSGNWGANNIPKFQSFLEQNFPRVQLKQQGPEQEGEDDSQ